MASTRTAVTPDTDMTVSKGPTNLRVVETCVHSNAFLQNAKHTHISGGSFNNYSTSHITNVNSINSDSTVNGPLGVLQNRVAANAILSAHGHANQVRCHPGTGKKVIERVERWRIDAAYEQAPAIFWLSGPEGSGKSAIVQTIAEVWKKKDIPQANFFFYRSDPSRNSLRPLMATLVHQITLLYPQVRESVEELLSKDPLVLDYSIEEQLIQLIINPLRALRKPSSSYHPPMLMIDGLDECISDKNDDQRKILHAFNAVLKENPGFVCLFVASRDEFQILEIFKKITAITLPLNCDDPYSLEDDIRIFVSAELAQIKTSHPLGHELGDSWPPVGIIKSVVEKSSGRFICAVTIMRHIAVSSERPDLSVQKFQDVAVRTEADSPFPALDAIYTHILSQVNDQEALQDILHTQLLTQHVFLAHRSTSGVPLLPLLSAYKPRYTEAVISSCLTTLTPIAEYTRDEYLLFRHASFTEYLQDKSRSGNRFVDPPAFRVKLLPAMWKCAGKVSAMNYAIPSIEHLKHVTEMPPDFLKTLLALHPSNIAIAVRSGGGLEALANLRMLCKNDSDLTDYARLVRRCIEPLRDGMRESVEPQAKSIISRQLAMVSIEDNILSTYTYNDSDVENVLSATDGIERREIAFWIQGLLIRMQKELYENPLKNQRYKPLLKQWVSYALTARIPLEILELDALPAGQQYLTMAQVERDIKRQPTTITLSPDSDVDRRDIAEWLHQILRRIHEEVYENPDTTQDYKPLLKQWISYAITARISLKLKNIPGAQQYLLMTQFERDIKMQPLTITLIPDSVVSDHEIAVWVNDILHRIHKEVYGNANTTQDYTLLLKQWISYALTEGIPLKFLQLHDLPGAQQYLLMTQFDRDIKMRRSSIVLSPDSVVDAHEIAVWVNHILHRVHKEVYGNTDARQYYKPLLKQWMSFSATADIPLSVLRLDDLPGARQYLLMAQIKHDIQHQPKTMQLSPNSVIDVHEIAVWLAQILNHIYTKTSSDLNGHRQYKRLLKHWMLYAITTKLPLDVLELGNLPSARRYLLEVKMKRWFVSVKPGTGE